ncbi:hypothetical protein [Shewanella sp. GXUN23E]|uniref:hypothetical protein n=1 Tax=Shewanella sp. GXUN23E TaxID=3422498 RepID=UPI003D7DCBA5
MNWIKRIWTGYCDWCDRMGLTPESRRCCAPSLSDPQLERRTECRPLPAATSADLPAEKPTNKPEHAD